MHQCITWLAFTQMLYSPNASEASWSDDGLQFLDKQVSKHTPNLGFFTQYYLPLFLNMNTYLSIFHLGNIKNFWFYRLHSSTKGQTFTSQDIIKNLLENFLYPNDIICQENYLVNMKGQKDRVGFRGLHLWKKTPSFQKLKFLNLNFFQLDISGEKKIQGCDDKFNQQRTSMISISVWNHYKISSNLTPTLKWIYFIEEHLWTLMHSNLC